MTETECQFCGQNHGVRCPSVKAIEYYEDGKVRRVEFVTAADYPGIEVSYYPGQPAHSWPNWSQNPTRAR